MLCRYLEVKRSPVPSLLSLSSSSIQNERGRKRDGRNREGTRGGRASAARNGNKGKKQTKTTYILKKLPGELSKRKKVV